MQKNLKHSMNKVEAAITTRINKWFPKIVPTCSPWEVKHTRGSNSFYLSEIAEHQYNYLYAATTSIGCTWKIPDSGYGYNPFDVIHYKNTDAYVIIVFPVMVYAIEIRDIMEIKKPSLDEVTALKLAKFTTKLSDL